MNEKAKKILAYMQKYMRENKVTEETEDLLCIFLAQLSYFVELEEKKIIIPFEKDSKEFKIVKEALYEAGISLGPFIEEYLYDLCY